MDAEQDTYHEPIPIPAMSVLLEVLSYPQLASCADAEARDLPEDPFASHRGQPGELCTVHRVGMSPYGFNLEW